MTRLRVTGFGSSNEPEPSPDSHEKTRELTAHQKMLQVIVNYIRSNYSPIGAAQDKVFKSSVRIQYELRRFYTYSLSDICRVMEDGGFKVEFLNGSPYWVVYDIHPQSSE